jgi:chromate transporter
MALGQVTPGPVVITATFVGYRIVGLTGALLATAAVFLPAFLMVLTLGTSVERFRSNPSVQAFLDGIQPAIVGLMFAAAALLVRHGVVDPVGGVLAVVSFVLIARWQVAPAWVLLGSCAVGVAATLLGV